ncbi:helix-turn-helix domain-containing protein [Flavihumibacter stibioxidans]|uniref:Transcriptional regulator n=1 Tax=Flavihumibacter stibioxidans TaxID=1834163 RepID=A0ABR7MDD7_9BACT|nr:AraC family transcriptional regulator [Flavihumibacter stibioxidans]MBC6493033.1 transcriptional regulator [Flavihumibacter stibioxidans]
MTRVETIEEFYQRKFGWMPDAIRNEIGHFNVFKLDPYVGTNAQPVPYKRRDFYKIMLVKGNSRVHYADRIISVKKQALSFSNPQIPYKWECTENITSGVFCIFDRHFFHHFGKLSQYAVFQPGGRHMFELTDDQFDQLEQVYQRMFTEIESGYIHKYDVLRNMVFELLHFAMKLDAGATLEKQTINAAERIATLFLELLERQFPIDENHRELEFRTASDFAGQLNIHVNHLNRAVKESSGKTTTQVIAERVVQEAKILLKHSSWNVTEISDALGFTEVTHFNNFFKKHTQLSPLKFRNI